MSERALDELFGGEASAAPVAEPAAVETPAPQETPAPAAAPEAEPAPVVAEAAPAPEAPKPEQPREDHLAPVQALLDERQKRQAAEREAQQLRAWRAEREQRERQLQQQMPNVFDDPEGFGNWLIERQREAVMADRQQHQQQIEVISRNMMARHLGAEKFGELEKFIESAPDQAHDIALKQADPYGWFYERFEEAQRHRRAQEAVAQVEKLGGKSIEDVIAERVAEAVAKLQAQQQPAPTPAEPAPASDRARNPDGTFAPNPQQQRQHAPPSLAAVNGATAGAGAGIQGRALDQLFSD